MSGLPLIATVEQTCREVRLVPIGDIATFTIFENELACSNVPSGPRLALASAASSQSKYFKRYRAGTSP